MSWGGAREGSGRKVGWRKEISEQRPRRQLVAFDDEWDLIQRFIKQVKTGDKDKCRELLDKLETDSTR